MIFKRFAANLRAQNWFAIGIEVIIVIIGVFIGTWVAEWNSKRVEEREVTDLILRLRPQLVGLAGVYRDQQTYFATTRAYARTALAGWSGDPRVSDQEFVVVAYQASQVTGLPIDSAAFASIVGSDQVRMIEDPDLRDTVTWVMTTNYAALQVEALHSDYRQDVREVIPDAIQKPIRDQCGDKPGRFALYLPPTCTVDLDPGVVAQAAAVLRAEPNLARKLNAHLAQIDNYMAIAGRFAGGLGYLITLIDETNRGKR